MRLSGLDTRPRGLAQCETQVAPRERPDNVHDGARSPGKARAPPVGAPSLPTDPLPRKSWLHGREPRGAEGAAWGTRSAVKGAVLGFRDGETALAGPLLGKPAGNRARWTANRRCQFGPVALHQP